MFIYFFIRLKPHMIKPTGSTRILLVVLCLLGDTQVRSEELEIAVVESLKRKHIRAT